MNTALVFRSFEQLICTALDIQAFFLDYDSDTEQAGFHIGINRCLRNFVINPGPAVVIGLETEQELRSSKNKGTIARFLDLPCVTYCQLPIAVEGIQSAANAVRDKTISPSQVETLKRDVTIAALERVNRNVTHVLKGAIVATMRDKLDAIRTVLAVREQADVEQAPMLIESQSNLKDAASLKFYCTRLGETATLLRSEIELLDGIGPDSILLLLREQHRQLCDAAETLKTFTFGIEAWAGGDSGNVDLELFVTQGEKVSRMLVDTSRELEFLPNKVSVSAAHHAKQ
jgi:hypothetical protein